jgi:Leucine-rich repeat (LRR) protein
MVWFLGWAGLQPDNVQAELVRCLVQPQTAARHGELSPHLGNLTFLSLLKLTNTGLAGQIPACVGKLHRLRALILAKNQLSGPIPPTIGNLTSLEFLDLSSNNLSYQIPPDLLLNMPAFRKFIWHRMS